MADKYYRLVKFVVDISPQPQRKLLNSLVSASTAQGSQFDLGAYFRTRKGDIDILLNRKLIRQDQYELILPVSGSVDLDKWDLTLLSLILKDVLRTELKQMFPQAGQAKTIWKAVDDIRSVRNDLQHKANTAQVTPQEFDAFWDILENATLFLAQKDDGINNTSVLASQMKTHIDEAKLNNMPDLGDYLRQWYTDMYAEMRNELLLKIASLEDQLKHIAHNTKTNQEMLMSASVKRKGLSGAPTKYMRTVDPRIERMRGKFAASMQKHLQEDHGHLEDEISRIEYHLKEYHRAVISTNDRKRSHQSVLAAINNMEYQPEHCLEVTDPLDWKIISSDDARMVVFRDPFGNDIFDENKTKATLAELEGIIQFSQTSSDAEITDVAIISDQAIFEQCQRRHYLELPEIPLVFSNQTTPKTPIDLTKDTVSCVRTYFNDSVQENITEMTRCYMRQNAIPFTDKMLLREAKNCLNLNKIVIIRGPRRSGRTALAVKLMSDYSDESCLVLTEPSELKHANFASTCVVVVEDIGGKQQFDKTEAHHWFRKFDLIYAATKEGKLKIILTVEISVFNTWIRMMPDHLIFNKSHVVEMPKQPIRPIIRFKQEVTATGQTEQSIPDPLPSTSTGDSDTERRPDTISERYRPDTISSERILHLEIEEIDRELTLLNSQMI